MNIEQFVNCAASQGIRMNFLEVQPHLPSLALADDNE
jgi:hypothetical protein